MAYAFSGRIKVVILRNDACSQSRVTTDLYAQLAEKRSSEWQFRRSKAAPDAYPMAAPVFF